MRFCHLKIKTEYSLLSSTIKIQDIVNYAKLNNSLAIGIADNLNLTASFHLSANLAKLGIKTIIGINIFLEIQNFIGIISLYAKNENGYKNLLQILYKANFEGKNIENDIYSLNLKDILSCSNDIICITGGKDGIINQLFYENYHQDVENFLIELNNIFNQNLYIELTRHGLKDEKKCEEFLISLSRKYKIPLVATNDCNFVSKEEFFAYDCLYCIGQKKGIYDPDKKTLNENYYLKTEEEMIELFSDIPEAIENTIQIAKRCSFFLRENKPRFPSVSSEYNITTEDSLIKNVQIGFEDRISKLNYKINLEEYKSRMNFELEIINKVGFAGYFLIVSDFVKWAKNNNIAVGAGRGSGAGSIVAWSLNITDVDPIKYKLFFERFLNPERLSMPDFDIDFCQERRHEVIEYIKNKYGKNRVANIITYGKLNAKAVLKDVGRVMEIPYVKIDELSKLIPFNPLEQITIEKALAMDLKMRQEYEQDQEIQQVIDIAMILEGINRHSSKHAAGIIISDEDLYKIAPVKKDPESDMLILGYDMKDAEKIGLLKFDFLGLKTLTVISKACNLIKDIGINIDIDNLDLEDEKTFKLLQSGKLKGVFQLEAAIPRSVLKKIKTNKFEDIAAITSLNRPGPMDNIPTYIKRYLQEEEIDYYESCLKDCLDYTYGVIIYQEQVLQIAQKLAGYSLGEADILRKAMGKKIQKEMDAQREIFVSKAEKHGIISKERAEYMFNIIAKFAGYGFNRAHAISYSMISFQTAYLKAHYPLQFFTSLLNLDIDDTDKLNILISDAKGFGIKFIMPNLNNSDSLFQCNNDKNEIIYGLSALKSVGLKNTDDIINIRNKNTGFKKLEDFLNLCVGLVNKKNLESFIKSGALDFFGYNRNTLLQNIEILLDLSSEKNQKNKAIDNFSLFNDSSEDNFKLNLKQYQELSEKELLDMEYQVIGFYLSKNPFEQYQELIQHDLIITSDEIEEILYETKEANIIMFGTVSKIIQRFKKNGRFAFLHMVDISGNYETMIFNDDLIEENRDNLTEGNKLFLVVNLKESNNGGYRLLVKKIYNINDFIKDKDSIIKELNKNKKINYKQSISKTSLEKNEKSDQNNIEKKKEIEPNNILYLQITNTDDLIKLKKSIDSNQLKSKKIILQIDDTEIIINNTPIV